MNDAHHTAFCNAPLYKALLRDVIQIPRDHQSICCCTMGLFGKRSSVFKNKHVLVTGGTGTSRDHNTITSTSADAEGIGLETAKELVRRGALVSVCSRSSSKTEAAVAQLQALAASVDGEGGRARAFGKPADVTVAAEVCASGYNAWHVHGTCVSQVAAMVASAEKQFGPIDTLISNAGMSTPGLMCCCCFMGHTCTPHHHQDFSSTKTCLFSRGLWTSTTWAP